jgi:hypothetical protein
MAIDFSTLRKPVNSQVVDPSTGVMRPEWLLYFQGLTERLNGAVDELGTDPAPADAQYVVASANASLTAERVATDTTTIDVDMGTAGQAKWNVLEVPGISTTGLVVRTAAATYLARTLTGPAAGITVTDGNGAAGDPTLALANDLAALEALGSTGFAVRTGSDAWAQRTLTGGANISVTDGDGVAGNPSIAFTGSILPTLGRRNIADISGGDTIIGTDQAKLVNIATGTGTLAFTAVATLAAGFWCIVKNSGTGNVTLNPDGAELIDGLANWILYPGGSILVECDGSALYSVLLSPMVATFNASGSFTKPGVGTWAEIEGWGAGGSGARGTNADNGGGAGGGYNRRVVPLSAIGTTETVTIGAGGAARAANSDGATGGDSTFGSLLPAFGGAGGDNAGNGGGGGGGPRTAGSVPSGAGGGTPGNPSILVGFTSAHGQGGDASAGLEGLFHGGGGASSANTGGNSVYGGAGGGGNTTAAAGNGGISQFGGNGGNAAVNGADAQAGQQPGGGGGSSEGVATGVSGAGGDGRIIVRVY